MSNNTTPASPLIVERQSPALKDRLWELVEEAKRGDTLAPVTVIGPTRYANLSLRQELGRTGFANIRFIVLPVLSEMLGAAAMARADASPSLRCSKASSCGVYWRRPPALLRR